MTDQCTCTHGYVDVLLHSSLAHDLPPDTYGIFSLVHNQCDKIGGFGGFNDFAEQKGMKWPKGKGLEGPSKSVPYQFLFCFENLVFRSVVVSFTSPYCSVSLPDLITDMFPLCLVSLCIHACPSLPSCPCI